MRKVLSPYKCCLLNITTCLNLNIRSRNLKVAFKYFLSEYKFFPLLLSFLFPSNKGVRQNEVPILPCNHFQQDTDTLSTVCSYHVERGEIIDKRNTASAPTTPPPPPPLVPRAIRQDGDGRQSG